MILSYFAHLRCLGLASFFLVHLATTCFVALVAPIAIRTARRLAPRLASCLLLTLRVLPFGLALFAVLGLCVPSYLWLEPEDILESVGFVSLFMAALGAIICGIAITRGVRAAVRYFLLTRRCQLHLGAGTPPAWVAESAAPLLAVAGVVRPHLIISQAIFNHLSQEELSVVLRHECAHRTSRDNLKRLCIFLAPGIMPFLDVFRELERSWISFAEYAADEAAVAGDPRRALALASALVHVARLGTVSSLAPSAISFLEDASDLSARVDRLLTKPCYLEFPHSISWHRMGFVLILAGSLAAMFFQSTTFRFVQSMLERLIR